RVLPSEPPVHKTYLVPALEIPLFELTLNGIDRLAYGSRDYGSTLASGWNHVRHGPWVIDQDNFTVNQIGHPYQGSMYYGFARSRPASPVWCSAPASRRSSRAAGPPYSCAPRPAPASTSASRIRAAPAASGAAARRPTCPWPTACRASPAIAICARSIISTSS